MIKKLRINEAKSSNIMLRMVNSEGTWYLIKSATRNKSFWNRSISYVNEFAKAETAIKKLYAVIKRLTEYAFYDEDDICDFEDEDDVRNAKFAEFYITDENGNTIEDISNKIKKTLLADQSFIKDVLGDFDYEYDEDE